MAKAKKCLSFFSCFLILTLVFSIPLFNLPGNNNIKKPQYGGTLRIKSFANVFRAELDPASPQSFIFLSEQLYDGLVSLDKNLTVIPALAEYWEISADGKQYTFHVRKNVTFHHGRELSAEDVKYSLERLINKNSESPYYQFFTPKVVGAQDYREGKAKDVAGFKVRDKYTFEIHWEKPYISCLYLLSMHFCKILPRDLVMDKGKGFFSKPSGTGPFQFDYWLRSPQLEIVGVRLKRNEKYFGGKPYVDAVEFSPYYTLDHFLEKEIDIIPVLSSKVLTEDFQVYQDGSLNMSFLGMSCNISPLDRQIVRKAISYGINKSAVARAAYTFAYLYELTNNYIPAKLPGFYPVDEEYEYDPERANQMLQEAGFSPEKKFPSLALFLKSPRTEVTSKIYRELRNQLDELGIKLRARYYKFPEEIKTQNEPYLVLTDRVMDFPDAENIIRPLFSSKSIFNVFHYSNPEIDRLLGEAESEKSWTMRIKLFHQMENILSADIPAIPLFTNQQRIAVQPYIREVEVPLLGFYYLDASKIWLDK